MQGNVLGQIGGNTALNIFTQPNEPTKKEGIWIKTPEKYKYEKVQFVDDYDSILADYIRLTDMPFNFAVGVAVKLNIYLLGSRDSDHESNNYNYKYDTLTDTYTKLTDIPFDFSYSSVVAVGTDIYILGGEANKNNQKYNYKYDTLTDTYTKLTDIPFKFEGTNSAVAIDDDVYLFNSSYYASEGSYNYKYDTLIDVYTRLSDVPFDFTGGLSTSINKDIYLFSYNNEYKYNTDTDTYIKLADLPESVGGGGAVAIDTDVYIFSGTVQLKYDSIANNYEEITNAPVGFPIKVSKDIYLIGSNNLENYKYRTNKEVSNKNILIEVKKHGTKLELNKVLETLFSNAKIYDNGELQDYLTYYGNGEEWILLNGSDFIQSTNTLEYLLNFKGES